MATRYEVGADIDGVFSNLYKDNRSYKTKKLAKRKLHDSAPYLQYDFYVREIEVASPEEEVISLKEQNEKLNALVIRSLEWVEHQGVMPKVFSRRCSEDDCLKCDMYKMLEEVEKEKEHV